MNDEDLFTALAAPFPPHRVSWRVGSVKKDGTAAMALAYIDARDVMGRFDDVCRPSGWERLHPHVDKTTTCEIRVKIPSTGEWVVKSDGAGDTAVEAEKGSLSDAFKRAAVNWGVGRYLYDLPTPWVRIDQYKKIVPEELTKLQRLLERDAPKAAPGASGGGNTAGAGRVIEVEIGARPRKSSAQAKRDGDHEKYTADIGGLDHSGVADWLTHFDEYTADAPISWLDPLRDKLQLRLEELNGAASVAGEAAEMDDAFRNGVGGTARGSVAGRNDQRQGEAA